MLVTEWLHAASYVMVDATVEHTVAKMFPKERKRSRRFLSNTGHVDIFDCRIRHLSISVFLLV
jgi:hypothetical protein